MLIERLCWTERTGRHKRQPERVNAKAMRKNTLLRVPGRTLHHIPFRGLHGKRERGKTIGNEVNPEDMNREERHGKPDKLSKEQSPDFTRIGRQEVLNKLSDVIVDLSASLTALTW
jgi:hypothetical protein